MFRLASGGSMELTYTLLSLLLVLVLGYLMGSFPNAVIIGKIYGIDIRAYGSHNAGGTNVGRTLGKFPGVLTICLDVLKSYLALLMVFLFLTYTPWLNVLSSYPYLKEILVCLTSLGTAIGHIYPLFAHFKGGKIVAVFTGFILFMCPIDFALCVILFFLVFAKFHRISISSLTAAPSAALLLMVPMILDLTVLPSLSSFNGGLYFTPTCMLHLTYYTFITAMILVTILVIRHLPNIIRIKNHKEPETHFQYSLDDKKKDNK